MKKNLIFSILLFSNFAAFVAFADFAPASGQGIVSIVQVQSGSGFLADTGRAVFATDVTGDRFALIGDENIDDGYGSYSWLKSSANAVQLTLNDEVSGVTVTYSLTFSSSDAGTTTASAPGVGTQSGTFAFYYILKKSEISSAFGLGQPVATVQDGKMTIDLQLKSSNNLSDFAPAPGSVSTIGPGKVRFTADAAPGSKFYTIEATEATEER